jgi:hypothetical protein
MKNEGRRLSPTETSELFHRPDAILRESNETKKVLTESKGHLNLFLADTRRERFETVPCCSEKPICESNQILNHCARISRREKYS